MNVSSKFSQTKLILKNFILVHTQNKHSISSYRIKTININKNEKVEK